MNIYLLLMFRFAHIVAGILWAGAAVFYLFFVKPSVHSIGLTGPTFMQTLTQRRRYPLFMVSVSFLTVLAGGVLYWHSSGGLTMGWIKTGPGMGFTIGSLAALVAFLVGNFGIGPTSAQMGELGQQMAASGGRPSSEQVARMQHLEKRLNRAEWIDFVMLAIAMLTMATARYWTF